MEKIYKLYKNSRVKYGEDEVTICGYTETHLIGAIQKSLPYTFKKPKDDSFIDPEYSHVSYTFCYVDESTILKQIKKAFFNHK